MIDQNKFINTYIDIIVNSLQDYLKANLQLQTQVKIHELVVAEKDQIIATLEQQLRENKAAEDWKVKYDAAETNYNSILNKLQHMDGLMKQLGDMKRELQEKDILLAELKKKPTVSKVPKKVINTTKIKEEASNLISKAIEQKTLDDF